jgi:hypothetical protein
MRNSQDQKMESKVTLAPSVADYFTRPGHMSNPGAAADLLADAPGDIAGTIAFVQNLVVHMHWARAYRIELTAERRDEANIRSLEDMLVLIDRRDARPLAAPRTPDQRMVGNCRHFSLFGTALLRRAGIPARARAGFGGYFNPGTFEDHWVVEHWNGTSWRLLDVQIDATQRALLKLDFDTTDISHEKFVIAGDAWTRCREGRADPKTFGIFDMRGLWFIASNVLRDFASLNGVEMLPWDVWGPMVMSDDLLTPQKLALFDGLAQLTLDVDGRFAELRSLYDADATLKVPAVVFNAERNRTESIS